LLYLRHAPWRHRHPEHVNSHLDTMHPNTSKLFGSARHGSQLWHRWRTLGTLVASGLIMAAAALEGYGAVDGGIRADWTSLMIYVCSAVIIALQVDRLMRH
jgi:hypothetical protein